MSRNARFAFIAVRCAAAALAFYATGRHPYNVYIFTRWAVFLACCWGIWQLRNRIWESFAPAYIAIGIIFNPLRPFHFAPATWHNLDVAAGVVLLASLVFQKNAS